MLLAGLEREPFSTRALSEGQRRELIEQCPRFASRLRTFRYHAMVAAIMVLVPDVPMFRFAEVLPRANRDERLSAGLELTGFGFRLVFGSHGPIVARKCLAWTCIHFARRLISGEIGRVDRRRP